MGEIHGLRMPLYAKYALRLIFNRLDDPVFRACGDREAGGRVPDGLVVEGVDGHLFAAVDLREQRTGLEIQTVRRVVAVRRGLLMAERFRNLRREILIQRAAEGDVQDLFPPADAEDRQMRGARGPEKMELKIIV